MLFHFSDNKMWTVSNTHERSKKSVQNLNRLQKSRVFYEELEVESKISKMGSLSI